MKKKWSIIFLGLSIFITALVTFLIFKSVTNFGCCVNIVFGLIVFLPAITLALNMRKENETIYTYLTLLIFYSGCIIAILYFKPVTHGLEIPKLNAGTFGFRSNNAEVEIDSIRIWYQDSDDSWKEIPKDSLQKKNNWLMPVKPYSSDINLSPIKCIYQGADSFLINNCTILFIPKSDSLFAKFSNIRIEVKITFNSITGENPGFSIITNRSTKSQRYPNDSTKKVYSNEDKKEMYKDLYEVEDLCLEFVFPFYDYAHPWIPALEWMPGTIQTSSFLDVEQSFLKTNKKKEKKMKYTLSAFVFDDQVRFTLNANKYKGVKCLYEAKIENNCIGIDGGKNP